MKSEPYPKIESEDQIKETFSDPKFKMIRAATSFFRNDCLFNPLIEKILPSLGGKKINIWSAGCSSGQEAYSLALALFIDDPSAASRVRIFATDIDEEMIETAKKGAYVLSKRYKEAFGPLFEKYVSEENGMMVFSDQLKKIIDFQVRDIFDSASLPKMDIIVCNHVLQYYSTPMQEKVIMSLTEKLDPKGFIYLDVLPSNIKKMALKQAFEGFMYWYKIS